MGSLSTLSQASSSLSVLISPRPPSHCRAFSSSICVFNSRESSRRTLTFGTLRLSYFSSAGGAGGRRAVVSEESSLRLESHGGDGVGDGDGGFGDGGGGGGGGDDNDNDNNSNSDSGDGEGEASKSKGMSMSQKLTLAYAALVGVGGVMGYVKGGSQKSLASGGLSALLLFFVFNELPSRPALASSLGLGLAAALLAVMGSRFKKSRKVFPAGVVAFVSFIMAGGYLHGILRSLHA